MENVRLKIDIPGYSKDTQFLLVTRGTSKTLWTAKANGELGEKFPLPYDPKFFEVVVTHVLAPGHYMAKAGGVTKIPQSHVLYNHTELNVDNDKKMVSLINKTTNQMVACRFKDLLPVEAYHFINSNGQVHMDFKERDVAAWTIRTRLGLVGEKQELIDRLHDLNIR